MKALKNTRTLATMAMLCAISIILFMAVRFPIFPAAPFLIYEPADIPIIIGAFTFGPVAGIILTVVVSLLQSIIASSDGWIGALMHVFATGALVLVAGGIYKLRENTLFAVIGLFCGTVAMAASMALLNLVFTPIFMGVPLSVVKGMTWPVIIPFNLIKAGVNSILGFAVFKAIVLVVKRRQAGV